MRRNVIVLIVLCLVVIGVSAIPAAAQDNFGVSVTCPNGLRIDNGVEVVVNMRPGFTYTATAIGIDGFDPVLAVSDQAGVGLCADDDQNAISYSASLPSTGFVGSSNLNSQVPFSHSYNGLADISIIVGGFDGQTGEFLLVLEGMAVTGADGSGAGAGDPFSVRLTPNLISTGVPLSVYMISTDSQLDPLIQMVLSDGQTLFTDDDGNPVYCDDAGDANLCWGDSTNLSSSFVSQRTNNQLPGYQYDSTLSIPLAEFAGLDFSAGNDYFFNFLMKSYEQSSFGEYLVAFHMSVGGDAGGGGSPPNNNAPQQQAPPPSTSRMFPNIPQDAAGVNVTCPNGFQITNAVEVIVSMRPGFTYTATAIGIDGFDPVLAVADQTGVGLCADDDTAAISYTAALPSSGFVGSSNFNSQVPFSHNFDGLADISIMVGGFDGQTGEFLLVLEGMAVTEADGRGVGAGDPYSVMVTPNLIASGVPLSIYMISLSTQLDPLIQMVLPDGQTLFTDDDGVGIFCDDAGNTNLCWGESQALNNSYVSQRTNNRLPGYERDAMLSIPLGGFAGLDFSGGNQFFFNYLMTSFEQRTFGEYLVAFHMGIGATGGGGSNAKR